MEIQPQQSVDDQPPIQEIPETPPPEATPPLDGEPPEGGAPEGDPGEWEADLSYKVRDEDKKMDEGLAGLIDSKEREDYFRDLYTKADGLDWVKENLASKSKDFDDLTAKHSTLDSEYNKFQEGMSQLAKLKADDFMAFQRHWQIPDKQILERAQIILELDEKGLDAQRENERNFEQRQTGYQNERALQEQSARSTQASQELHQMKVQQAMAAPDIANFRTEYNKRLGDGAFEAAVDDYGSLEYHKSQRYVDPQVAVAEVYKRNLALIPTQTQPPESQTQGDANPNETPAPRIPNLGQGRPGGQVRKRIKTMADLRKHAESIQSSEY